MLRAFAVLAALSACSSDPTGSVPPEAIGTYTLVSVNSGRLPALIVATAERQEQVVSGELVVLFSGAVREERVREVTEADGTTMETTRLEGTLHIRGSSLELRTEAGETYAGFYSSTAGVSQISFVIPVGTADMTCTYREQLDR